MEARKTNKTENPEVSRSGSIGPVCANGATAVWREGMAQPVGIAKLSGARRLVDSLGRAITYLRVSLTEKCNLRCGYCYDSSGNHRPNSLELCNDDILRLIRAFHRLGVNKVRFTGGEPLLRRGINDLIGQTAALDGISLVALSTNGLLLEPVLPSLIDAGLNRLNISLDSLDRSRYRMITGVDGLERVIAATKAAEKSGVFPWVKINTVVMRGINDCEVPAFAEWALSQKMDLRFIEFMPTKNSGWTKKLFVGEAEMRRKIGLDFEVENPGLDSDGPARRYRYRDYPGRVSFISAVSRSFCNSCNRLRLTSKGKLVGCLFQSSNVGLKKMLDNAAADSEIADRLAEITAQPGFRRIPDKVSITDFEPSMKAIGG